MVFIATLTLWSKIFWGTFLCKQTIILCLSFVSYLQSTPMMWKKCKGFIGILTKQVSNFLMQQQITLDQWAHVIFYCFLGECFQSQKLQHHIIPRHTMPIRHLKDAISEVLILNNVQHQHLINQSINWLLINNILNYCINY